MSPQIIIISSAMSLGGMASVGFSHFQQTEEQVSQRDREQVSAEKDIEVVSQLGERVDSGLDALEKSLESKRQREMQQVNEILGSMMGEIAAVKNRQSSTEILLGALDKEQARQGFKIETHERSFRPLRSINSRFQRVEKSSDLHPLLPSLETSWEDNY